MLPRAHITSKCKFLGAGMDGPIISVAASRYFSAQVTADGRVWTFGGGFNGELGAGGSSWASAAQAVDGPVGEVSILKITQPVNHLRHGIMTQATMTRHDSTGKVGEGPRHKDKKAVAARLSSRFYAA